MKKLVLTLSLVLFVFSISIAKDGEKYGKDLTLKDVTKVSEILATPDKYEGKKLLIEGTVVAVCAKAGCWIDIASDKEMEKIRVKVNDGEIVFPMELKGQVAKVEGELYSIMVTPESCEGEGGDKKCSDEKKDECKAKKAETEGKKVYMLKGFGAEVAAK